MIKLIDLGALKSALTIVNERLYVCMSWVKKQIASIRDEVSANLMDMLVRLTGLDEWKRKVTLRLMNLEHRTLEVESAVETIPVFTEEQGLSGKSYVIKSPNKKVFLPLSMATSTYPIMYKIVKAVFDTDDEMLIRNEILSWGFNNTNVASSPNMVNIEGNTAFLVLSSFPYNNSVVGTNTTPLVPDPDWGAKKLASYISTNSTQLQKLQSLAAGWFDPHVSDSFFREYHLKSLDLRGLANCGMINTTMRQASPQVYEPATPLVSIAGICHGNLSVETINLAGLDTRYVTDMQHAFAWCENLHTLNLRDWVINEDCDTDNMFHLCHNLCNIIGPIKRISRSGISFCNLPLTPDSIMNIFNALEDLEDETKEISIWLDYSYMVDYIPTEDEQLLQGDNPFYVPITHEQYLVATSKGWSINSGYFEDEDYLFPNHD